jgi:subfamily B ATP-binding cassette protein MsbA
MNSEARILWSCLRTHWPVASAAVVLSLLASAFEVFSIGMLIPFLQTFADASAPPFRTDIAWVDTHLLAVDGSALSRTYRICALILVGTWLRALFGWIGGVYAVKSRVRIVEDLRLQIVDQLQKVSLQFFARTRGGDLLNSITTEISRTTAAVSVIFNTVQQSALLVMYALFMTWISWQLTLFVFVVFGLLSLGLSWLMRAIRSSGRWLTEANSRFTSRITEFIEAIRTITAYNRQPHERDRLQDSITDLADATVTTFKRSSLVQPLSQGIVGSIVVVLIVVAVQFYVIPGHLDIAFILGFLFALFRLMPAVNNLNDQRGVWASNRAGLSKVARLLDSADKPYQEDGSIPATRLRSGIVFDGVSFSYEKKNSVLHNINIEIQAGKMVALVGGSGAGKSTLADLIPRFYDPTEGKILFDGTDLRKLDICSLREKVGIVSQNTFIFNDTVESNIAYGDLDASFDAIHEAAKQANALGFIENMEDGFKTVLGDRGVRLSGGQKQRIAIARAILRNPEILILDEATSNLDTISEKLVQQSMEQLLKNRTVIAIAHRLSTIENSDWVFVLEDGRIVEEGTYTDLIRRKGKLWAYHTAQYNRVAHPSSVA